MKPTIAIYVQHPYASSQGANGVIRALDSEFRFKIFTKHEQMDDFFDTADMICFPGGIGDSDKFDSIHPSTIRSIKLAVQNGTPYLGICMGAYWADRDYFDILEETRVEQYIKRPNTDTKRPHAKAQVINWRGKTERMYFYDGACMVGGNVDCVARYSNGDPMAIIQGNVGLIGCHPEAEKDWYDSYSWMRKEWTGGHHSMLLDFAKSLAK